MSTTPLDVTSLAKELHEAGRAAVTHSKTVGASNYGVTSRAFIEWADLSQEAKDWRIIQAQWLVERYDITPRAEKLDATHLS